MSELTMGYMLILKRDLRAYMQRKSESLATLLFFIIVVSLFPLALGPLPKNLLWLVPAIIWVAALLAVLLAQENLLRMDYQLGIFEQMLLSPHNLIPLLIAKITANWLVSGLPLVLITPLLAQSFSLPNQATLILTASLAIGTPILSLLGTLGAAMTLSLARGGLLLAVLILPLYIPLLILGAAASVASLQGLSSSGHLALLVALLIVALLFVPLALTALIKVSTT